MFRYLKIVIWVIVFGIFVSSFAHGQSDDGDNGVVYSDHADPAMITAIATARETLPKFWEVFDSGDRDYEDFSIKVGMETTDGSFEHIWVNSLKNKKGKMSGKLANDPVNIPDVKFGDKVKFNIDDVTDWTYSKDGRLHGHYTTRVLLKTMDPQTAAYMKTLLSENP